jgi:hypothetical protein
MVREIRNRVGSKVAWALLWNLPYEAMVDLAGQLELGGSKATLEANRG